MISRSSKVLLLCLFPFTSALAILDCPPEYSNLECLIYKETNRLRIENRLQPLQHSDECTEASIYHAQRMHETGVYAHNIEGDLTFPERMSRYQVRGNRMAENIHNRRLDRFTSDEEAAHTIVLDWYNSQGHRRNMLNREFQSIGIATYGDFQVQCFTTHATEQAPKVEFPRRSFGDFFREISPF